MLKAIRWSKIHHCLTFCDRDQRLLSPCLGHKLTGTKQGLKEFFINASTARTAAITCFSNQVFYQLFQELIKLSYTEHLCLLEEFFSPICSCKKISTRTYIEQLSSEIDTWSGRVCHLKFVVNMWFKLCNCHDLTVRFVDLFGNSLSCRQRDKR